MLRVAYAALVLALTITLVILTILPTTDLQEWWIRAMAFPRLQIIAAAVPLATLALFLSPKLRATALSVVLACIGFQAWEVFPFTPLAPKEIRLAPSGDDQLRFLAANVLMENRDHEAVASLIRRETPDVIFLMETDQTWIDALEPVLGEYDTVLTKPQDNHYGLAFATRLQVVDAQLLDLGDVERPTLYAELKDRHGRLFRFVGLHPAPPVPGEDTGTRNAKTAYTARFARLADVPVVIMGDFNQPAWSRFAQRFKRLGGYLDPRVGRGPLPSFDATHPLFRFPIDQIYVTPDVAVVNFSRGEKIGSDHFPMLATVRIAPKIAAQFNGEPTPLGPDEAAEVEQMVEKYAATLEHDMRKR
ncbi:endonuclease/exonuclease/phosphatase (EEP) superfamily protein YafD [Hoeflea halophila]|uniref:Endonuclease/exonuclease/phosphatase (EEP) superfamily protein YafD n=1 Tax=Hoeflea halophila TaxID=714899 RepID=A0A286IFW3_9HYPH|nr:endonuclease/exonuclease/phosphatase family protein [Hoeflea halophila]SOE19033.1 endonuclease/exonuclease/phosphatase (EEP) superfamily protein YafD [Hoeflea halophila]